MMQFNFQYIPVPAPVPPVISHVNSFQSLHPNSQLAPQMNSIHQNPTIAPNRSYPSVHQMQRPNQRSQVSQLQQLQIHHMHQAMNMRRHTRQWTREEDDRLREATQIMGTTRWQEIAKYVGNGRNQSQCSQRWQRVLDPKIKKTNWTEEEDQKLLSLVEAHGLQRWMRISAEFGNRSDVQCRYRYYKLQKGNKKDNFSCDPILKTNFGSNENSDVKSDDEIPNKNVRVSLPSIALFLENDPSFPFIPSVINA
ncbi:Myb-like DNA-binding domain containing protein [Tritrichomonas foetus]|uniref:Myb-like DNA-binding domain containing protein n=1 Tax=Tritrichomonas foetus TaxID=1144522 RepID=A0A1J4JA87_9EUKA|nr:Myb-like DNA-binding domain containing protein [Tritrichomonas foetus]|eukprot:OHS94547.1 Myb-like DNA-binding domain containing protein [Tritrichomonas foetus]